MGGEEKAVLLNEDVLLFGLVVDLAEAAERLVIVDVHEDLQVVQTYGPQRLVPHGSKSRTIEEGVFWSVAIMAT